MTPTLAPGEARLTLVCRSLDGGGAERVMLALAGAFAERGHPVDLVVLVGRNEGDLGTLHPAVHVAWLEAARPELAAPRLLAHLKATRPHAVLATLVLPNALAVACAALVPAAQRPRVVVREANTLSVALRHRTRASRLVAGAVARAFYPRADAIVAVSNGARDDLARFLSLPPSRITAIANPSPHARLLASGSAPLAHPWLTTPRAVPVVVAAGRLVPKKGFEVLLRALAEVRRTRDVRLYLMGEGPERARLAAQITQLGLDGHVMLAGHVNEPFATFAAADLFVLPSLAEGMPNVLVEALALGCPVVATDCPSGPREILDDGRHGTLVPVGDARALASAMLHALATPRDHGAEARRARAAEYDLELVATSYLRVLCGM